jgi:hypothetical protein
MRRLFSALMILILLGGCEILGPDKDQDTDVSNRTYPEALDLPAANLQSIIDGVHAAGQFNLTAYVVGISECPPDYACLVADHIQVASSPHTDGIPLMIAAEKPSQFEQDREYVLSIEVFHDAFPESSQSRFVRLLAWSSAR